MSRMWSLQSWRKIILIIAICGCALSDQDKYSDGAGEPNNPYQISSVTDWQELMANPTDWTSHFVLTADIDLNDVAVIPVGSTTNPFTGVFDGNEYVIRNTDVNMPDSDYIGLFGSLGMGGEVKNLTIEDASVTGADGVGNFVGVNFGIISNCHSIGFVNATGSGVGGLVGYNFDTVNDCHSTGSVTGNDCVGGLVALNSAGSIISRCYSTGSVSGRGHVGGLVGENEHGHIDNCCSNCSVVGSSCVGGLVGENCMAIRNCYSNGLVIGNSCVGGLVGNNDYPGSITKCYSTGSASGTGSYVGGLVGSDAGIIGSSFWDVNTSGWETSGGGTPKTTAEMKTQSTFTDGEWDFIGEQANGTEDIWAICEETNYPRFVYQIPHGDIVCPDGVNGSDFAAVARHWQETDCAALNDCEGADIDLSGAVDFRDVAAVAESWLLEMR